mmetsp:Transcript_3998/g.5215  ORF Transcript_3998/g.5215 Transcript_3998/m.5215 type:complete len:666 (-) Transcript_3998:98-2095(-)
MTTAAHKSAVPDSTKDAGSRQVHGNLHFLLNAYDQNNDNASIGGIEGNAPSSDSISLQLDQMGRERSSTLGSIRERGLTFGSEFDLGLGLAGDNVSHDAFFDLSAVNAQKVNVVSAQNSNASGIPTANNVQKHHAAGGDQAQPQDVYDNSSQVAGFLSGMFNNNNSNNTGNSTNTSQINNGLPGHTPPTATATSYEIKHFGKRARSNSLSGRLRSMSDLEDRGLIDGNQKGILKDLIISGDDELNVAVEKYERGDTEALETMIKSGAHRARHSSDIDILGDLDLDFLSMNEEYGGDASSNTQTETKSMPIPVKQRQRSLSEISNMLMQHSNHGSDAGTSYRGPSPAMASSAAYDGIGDLDFNGDYIPGQSSDFNDTQQHSMRTRSRSIDRKKHPGNPSTKPRADSILDILNAQRNRANSLAFGGLLDEPSNAEESVGKWMDRSPVVPEVRSIPLKKRVSSHVVGANGGLYIINNSVSQPQDNQNPTKQEKLTAAEIKRREREDRKAMRDKEKLEKKLQKEREKLEKKERIAKEKKAAAMNKKKNKSETTQKKKKAELDKIEDEEPKVVVSGTGRPRSLSDPNLSIGLDANGLMQIEHPPDWVGAYSPESRKIRIDRFLAKRDHRVWIKKVKYDVRKNFADSRLRVKGRFVKKEDELLMRDMMSLT